MANVRKNPCFDVQPLHLRRQFLDLIFLFKLINGGVDSAHLLLQINFLIPRGTRSSQMFARKYQSKNYSLNGGLA
ncbi:hypothetical protein J6590_075419 [Homalodisca vitripennis]|nr:hypothetical protein J6590_075419 [Homalodisca vitripennis]